MILFGQYCSQARFSSTCCIILTLLSSVFFTVQSRFAKSTVSDQERNLSFFLSDPLHSAYTYENGNNLIVKECHLYLNILIFLKIERYIIRSLYDSFLYQQEPFTWRDVASPLSVYQLFISLTQGIRYIFFYFPNSGHTVQRFD